MLNSEETKAMIERIRKTKGEIEMDSIKYDLAGIVGSREPYGGLSDLQKRELEKTFGDRFSAWINNGESEPKYFGNA